MIKSIYISFFLLLTFSAWAQKPVKVWSNSLLAAMDSKEQADLDKKMDEAVVDFQKILSKTPDDAMSQFGLSVVYSFDTYSKHDYFVAWKYFCASQKPILSANEEEKAVLEEYFFKQDKKRRGRTLEKNIDWEQKLQEEKLIKFVREENNLDYANRFIAEFPTSKYYENVIHIRNYIEFRQAENTGTEEAMNQFIAKYPEAAQVKMARDIRNQIAYTKALNLKSLSALKAFVANYPDAVQVEEAKKVMGVMAFDEVSKTHSLDLLERYMIDYPNSTKMPDAKILKRQWLFEWAKSINSIDAYNTFVALYPEGEMYIDIFNLKADALGKQILMDFPVENYTMIKAFDNKALPDWGGDVVQRKNGDLLLVTNSIKAEGEMTDSWLLGLDGNGKMLWNKFLGNEFDDQVNKVWISPNDEIYVAGITNAIKDSIKGKAWMYKLDAQGKNVFNRKLDGTEVMDFAVYPDNKLIVASYLADDSTSQSYLYKLSESGKKLWERRYTQSDKLYGLYLHPDRTVYLAAGTWIAAIDEGGYLMWDKKLDAGQKYTAVNQNEAGQIVFAGVQDSLLLVSSFDGMGNKNWEVKQFFTCGYQVQKITPLADLSCIISGSTPDHKVIFIKVDHTGKIGAVNIFSNAEGLQLNGINAIGGNSVVVSLTRLGLNPDVVVLKMGL